MAYSPPPKALQDKGILRCTSNLQEGERLDVSASLIWLYFGEELLARVTEQKQKKSATEAPP